MLLGLLGGFLVMVGALALFYAPGQLMKTPLDVDSTTHLSGEATIGSESAAPVQATSVTRTDSAESDGDVVVWVNSSCLLKDEGDPPACVSADDPQERLIDAGVDNFATKRVSGLAVNDPKYLPPDATEHRGLVNKWPFESKKQTYPYWDGTVGAASNANYDGTLKMSGLDIYRYKVNIEDEPIEVTDGVQGSYTSEKTIYVEPLTGAIVNQTEHQVRTTDEGDNVLTLDLAFTGDQVKTSVKDAKSNKGLLDLVRHTVPLVGFILGVPVLIVGILLSVRATRREREA